IFGSYSRGEQTPESDVDILVEFDGEKQLTIFDDLYIAEYLAEKLGIKVDLVEKNLLHPRVAKYVLPELRTL
ncbi:MAG: nucleotidyltransferase domain-containing protein, partial [Rhizobacter sp.]|nr:nucleotidyltransferase domain-containing protein [Chlorobiales bacterium]